MSVRSIFITMDSMFPLRVLVINKSKDTFHKSVFAHVRLDTFHKSVFAHVRLKSFSLDLIPCFWPIFVNFQNEAVSLCVNNLINKDVK